MNCPKCNSEKVIDVIFVYMCGECRHVFCPPEKHAQGAEFLIQRYINPTPENHPGGDVEIPLHDSP